MDMFTSYGHIKKPKWNHRSFHDSSLDEKGVWTPNAPLLLTSLMNGFVDIFGDFFFYY